MLKPDGEQVRDAGFQFRCVALEEKGRAHWRLCSVSDRRLCRALTLN